MAELGQNDSGSDGIDPDIVFSPFHGNTLFGRGKLGGVGFTNTSVPADLF
jgi:hypothetical protein